MDGRRRGTLSMWRSVVLAEKWYSASGGGLAVASRPSSGKVADRSFYSTSLMSR